MRQISAPKCLHNYYTRPKGKKVTISTAVRGTAAISDRGSFVTDVMLLWYRVQSAELSWARLEAGARGCVTLMT